MKYVAMLVLLALGLLIVGCHAEGDIDPHGSTSMSIAR